MMAADSRQRKDAWLKTGCNAFDGKRLMSKPLSIWTTQDVYRYTRDYKLPYCPGYMAKSPRKSKLGPKRKIQRKTGRLITTGEAYRRLAKLLNIPIKECHFGWFDKDALCKAKQIMSNKEWHKEKSGEAMKRKSIPTKVRKRVYEKYVSVLTAENR